MKKPIIFFLTCCLFYSCENNKYHYLPTDKTPLLTNGDITYFMDSVSSRIDTFRLDVSKNWWHSQEGDYYLNININYNNFNRMTTFLIFNLTSASVVGANFGIDYDLSKIAYDFSFKTVDFTIKEITYTNVYIANNFTALSSDSIPNKVYFTCQNGIIRYEYKDGRVYNLVSK